MVARNNRSLPVALAAVGKLGTFKVLDKILPYLQRPEKEVRDRRDRRRRATRRRAAGRSGTAVHSAGRGRRRGNGVARGQRRRCRSSTAASRRAAVSRPRRAAGFDVATATPTSTPMSPTARAQSARASAAPPPIGSLPRRRPPARRRPHARCSSKAPKPKRVEPPPPEAPSFDLNALQRRRHDRRPLQVHSEDRQRRVRHRGARRGHGRRGTPDLEVLELRTWPPTRRC